MLTTNIETRTLTLVLLEDEWRALREAEPDPVAWLKEQVRERLERVEKSDDRARAGKAEEPAAADA